MITITDEAIEQIRRMQGEIADLRYEAGMYQSLYEVSQKRVEELLSQLGKATQESDAEFARLTGIIFDLYKTIKAAVQAIDDEQDDIAYLTLKNTLTDDLGKPKGVYGEMCMDPKLCAGKGYCPRDPACNE